MKRKVLNKKFFCRPTLEVAQDLLGKFLVCKTSSLYKGGLRGVKEVAVMITEVEAYDGPNDKASHASRGLTERNAVMFDEGGCFYVYLCYGMYEMLNIVTGKKDYPAAILFRGAIIPLPGEVRGWSSPLLFKEGQRVVKSKIANHKSQIILDGLGKKSSLLTKEGMGEVILNGPGKLTKFLKINRAFNKKTAVKKTGLWFEDRGVKITKKMIKRTPRIGVAYAGPIWSKKLYRFVLSPSLRRRG
jgi:DNA-3-methyladenine glycosylase